MIRTKSIRTAAQRTDGLRILATRFRGRGLREDRYDVWMPSLAPSERLLRRFQAGDLTWAAFRREFRRELLMDGGVDAGNRTVRNHGQKFTLRLLAHLAAQRSVTLLCHCSEEERHCHRRVLRELIERI